ncbi:hypothetical protein KALB_1960 [Kutzneria albida DSM 43870]|uniref:Uncharacterized protein n=2 Tax=Kutzneria TaxID=43356 RepID=W5W3H3_9PSEU|nr:hypothetical protein KALB_1960 [Kutzneria albida DSM 43870]
MDAWIYGHGMTAPEATSLDELISDCADIPSSLHARTVPLPTPRDAAPWEVDEVCTAQVSDLDDYGL